MLEKTRIFYLGEINSVHNQKWIQEIAPLHELHVFSLSPLNDLNKCNLVLSTFKLYSPEQSLTKNGGVKDYLKTILKWRKLFKKLKPKIVHAHYASSYGFLASLLPKSVLYVSIWGSDINEFPKRSFIHKWVFKFTLSRASKVFSTSKQMAEELKLYTDKKPEIILYFIIWLKSAFFSR